MLDGVSDGDSVTESKHCMSMSDLKEIHHDIEALLTSRRRHGGRFAWYKS